MNKTIAIGGSCTLSHGSGINAYVNQLVDLLLAMGHSVIYIGPYDDKYSGDRDNLDYFSAGNDEDPKIAVERLLKLFDSQPIELIINNDNAYLQSVAPWVNCVFVSVGHMSKTSVATLACFNHQWLDYIVTISGHMQKTYIHKYGLDTAKVPIIYNGVNDPYAGCLPAKKPRKKIRMIYAGGNNSNKGARLLLKTIKDPRWSNYSVELAWYGYMDDAFEKTLLSNPRVTVHGRVSRAEFLSQLSASDIFLLPSYNEGCPMSMLEAMSYGVIPFASDGRGAMERIIVHGQEGYICRLDHWVDDFYAGLDVLAKQSSLIALFRERSYARFLTDFNSDHFVSRLLALSNYPTCDRNNKPDRLTVLRWHRPFICGTNKAPIIDRVCIKLGKLRKAGIIEAS